MESKPRLEWAVKDPQEPWLLQIGRPGETPGTVVGEKPKDKFEGVVRDVKPAKDGKEPPHGTLPMDDKKEDKSTMALERLPEARKPGEAKKSEKEVLAKVPEGIKKLPVMQPLPKDAKEAPAGDHSDNSNTQFATLAVWVAGRHAVPLERTVERIDRRFKVSQNKDGGWGYQYHGASGSGPTTPSMSCAGLLGLAVGHALADEKRAQDAQLQRGLKTPRHDHGK